MTTMVLLGRLDDLLQWDVEAVGGPAGGGAEWSGQGRAEWSGDRGNFGPLDL